MLPFSHSNRSNERSYNPVGSIIRRSKRSDGASNAPTTMPYKSYSNSNGYSYPENEPSFRQQFRPLHEQVMDPDLKNFVVPLTIPLEQPLSSSSSSYYRNGSSMNGDGAYYRNQMSHQSPPSPLLDQVLTETRLGTDDWYGKHKKGSSKLASIRNKCLLVMGLLAFGIFIYQASVVEQRERGSFKLRMSKDMNSKPSTLPLKPSPVEEASVKPLHIERVNVKPMEIPSEKRLHVDAATEKIIKSLPLEEAIAETAQEIMREKVLENLVILSINDDYETVVEVVRN